MKKIIVGCSTAILIFVMLLIISFYIYRSSIISDLGDKDKKTNNIWTTLVAKENAKNKRIFGLLKSYDFKNSDSLRIYLSNNLNINDTLKCNDEFVYKEYLLNKYFLITFDSYLENKDLLLENKEKFEKILKDIEEQNVIIEDYDSNVRDYNTFIGTFPNFIIAKSNGFKMKKYFEIKFGTPNKDPKKARLETLEWMKRMEK